MSKVNRSRAVNQWRHSVQHTAAKGKTVDTFAFVEMRAEESVENPCCDDDRSLEVDSIDAATEEKDSQEENDSNDVSMNDMNDSQQEEATTPFNGPK